MDTASIRNDLKESMKAHDEARTGTLRMLLASVANKEKEKRYAISKQEPALSQEELSEKARLTGDELVDAVSAEVKKRKEAAGEFEKGKRPELAKKELEEAEILMAYLPAQLSVRELEELAKEAVQATGASSIKDMGKVMARLSPKIKGRADGATVSKVVKKLLGND